MRCNVQPAATQAKRVVAHMRGAALCDLRRFGLGFDPRRLLVVAPLVPGEDPLIRGDEVGEALLMLGGLVRVRVRVRVRVC